jgi:uridine kinase
MDTNTKPRKKPTVIAVNAVSGGGKTAAANSLYKKLENSRVLHFDDYEDTDKNIPDIAKWVEDGSDYSLWHFEEMIADLNKLLEECGLLGNINCIILDYPFGYKQREIAKFIDLSVYIDTPLDIALARRIIRDISAQTQIDKIISELKGYLSSRNAYYNFQFAHDDADLKIDGSLPVEEITDIIIDKIKRLK